MTTTLPVKTNGFQKGREKTGGRTKKTPNRIPKLLRDCIIMAAEMEGMNQHGKDKLVGFLRHVARENLPGFTMLLGRVLPLQITAYEEEEANTEVIYRAGEELRRELESRGLTMETVQRVLSAESAKIIEHEETDGADGDGQVSAT